MDSAGVLAKVLGMKDIVMKEKLIHRAKPHIMQFIAAESPFPLEWETVFEAFMQSADVDETRETIKMQMALVAKPPTKSISTSQSPRKANAVIRSSEKSFEPIMDGPVRPRRTAAELNAADECLALQSAQRKQVAEMNASDNDLAWKSSQRKHMEEMNASDSKLAQQSAQKKAQNRATRQGQNLLGTMGTVATDDADMSAPAVDDARKKRATRQGQNLLGMMGAVSVVPSTDDGDLGQYLEAMTERVVSEGNAVNPANDVFAAGGDEEADVEKFLNNLPELVLGDDLDTQKSAVDQVAVTVLKISQLRKLLKFKGVSTAGASGKKGLQALASANATSEEIAAAASGVLGA
jgi:hypothetical protein